MSQLPSGSTTHTGWAPAGVQRGMSVQGGGEANWGLGVEAAAMMHTLWATQGAEGG